MAGSFVLGQFHEALRYRRWDLELTQEQVEDRAGLRRGFMSYVETGRLVNLPRAEDFFRLCDALEFSTAEALEMAGFLLLDNDSIEWLDGRRKLRIAA